MRRLLYLFNDAPFFLSHRLPVARAAADEGYEVHVATPASPAVVALERYGLTHHPIALTRGGVNPAGEVKALTAITR